MVNFFQSISEYIQLFWESFTHFLKGIATVFTLLLTSFTAMSAINEWMPVFISAGAFLAVSILVINYILGRIGNS